MVEVAVGENNGLGTRPFPESLLGCFDNAGGRERHARIDKHPPFLGEMGFADEIEINDKNLQSRNIIRDIKLAADVSVVFV